MKTTLAYNSFLVRTDDRFLNLTDMWKASGSPKNREPAQWVRTPGAEEYIQAAMVNMGKSHNEVFQTVRGGNAPGTWGHWLIAMAYGQYLSAEFHVWSNTVVRKYVENFGPSRTVAPVSSDASGLALPAEVHELIRRTDGIVRQLSHKMAVMEQDNSQLRDQVSDLSAYVRESSTGGYVSVKDIIGKAHQKGRRGLNLRIGYALVEKDYARPAGQSSSSRRCPHSNKRLFERSFAEQFMREVGNLMVKQHNDALVGQRSLFQIVPKRSA